jgi:deoxyguanosine kinase
MSATLISIIGPPAAGKTTLALALARQLPAGLIKEDYAGNPFLADSFAGDDSARLPGQLYFLMSRLGQLAVSSWPASGIFVGDYGYCQDRIFAKLLLKPDDLRLYERIARRVDGMVQPANLLIHLDADTETLLERIDHRGRAYERAMFTDFLQSLRSAHRQAVELARQVSCPIINLDTARHDFREESQLAQLIEQIRQVLPATNNQG